MSNVMLVRGTSWFFSEKKNPNCVKMGVEVPKKKSLIAPLIITAACLGIVQGLVWFALSLVNVLFYEGEILPARNDTYSFLEVGRTLYDVYLNKDYNDYFDQLKLLADITIIIGPREFNYFMYLYLVISFLLLVVSLTMIHGEIRKTSQQFDVLRIGIWMGNMIILSLLDLVLLCLLAHDYDIIKNKLDLGSINAKTIYLVSVGIVMTLAARGFIIWIINVIFIVIFGKYLHNLQNKGAQPDPSVLDAYTTGSRPPWDMSNNSLYADNNRPGYNNKGFRDDNDNPMITSSSQSFTHLPVNNRGRENDRDSYGNRDKGNQRGQYDNFNGQTPYDNFGSQNNSNNWNNKRSQSENALYAMGARNNSPLRPQSHADRTSDIPNPWGQPAPQRTAKIGRQGGQRSPPLNVNPPFIPDPDYSPPGSPRVRGVLRPKTNYAMY